MINSFVSGNTFPGGVSLMAKNLKNQEIILYDLSQTATVSVPNGVWDFHLIGWEGLSLFKGDTNCGISRNNILDGKSVTLEIIISKTGCTDLIPYTQHFTKRRGEEPSAFYQVGAGFLSVNDNTGNEICVSPQIDSLGNIICVGDTNGSLFESNGGGRDILLIKFSSLGKILWAKQFGAVTNLAGGSNAGNEISRALVLDSSDNIYITGYTSGGLIESNGGLDDIFVAKFDKAGNSVWSKQFGSTTLASAGGNAGSEKAYDISLDINQNLVIAGESTGNFGETNGGLRDALILKIDNSGNLLWVKHFGGTTIGAGSSNNDWFNGITVDAQNNIVGAGMSRGNLFETNGGLHDGFLVKLDPNGNIIWSKQFGAVSTFTGGSNSADDRCHDVITDSNNNVYCGGWTNGSMSETYGGGNYDAFVAKVDNNGNLLWHTQFGAVTSFGGDSSGDDVCKSLAIDSLGYVYCGGNTSSNFGDTNGGSFDPFIFKLNSSGDILWVTQVGVANSAGGNTSGIDVCESITLNDFGNIICMGSTTGVMGTISNAGGEDITILKFEKDGTFKPPF